MYAVWMKDENDDDHYVLGDLTPIQAVALVRNLDGIYGARVWMEEL